MATLLDGVNAVLQKAESLDSGGALTSLSDSSRQSWIDNAIGAINETIDRLYDLPDSPQRPNQIAEATITLATNDRDYALNAGLVRLMDDFGLINETTGHVIHIDTSPDAYRRIVVGDLNLDDTGLPGVCAIRPTDAQLFMDRKPTSAENGLIYKYRYEKSMALSVAADVFPFSDPVYRAVILAAGELYQKINHREFSASFFSGALAQAASRLSRLPHKTVWGEPPVHNATDPFQAA